MRTTPYHFRKLAVSTCSVLPFLALLRTNVSMGAESKFYKDATNNQLNLTLNVYGNKKQYLLSYILWFLVWL